MVPAVTKIHFKIIQFIQEVLHITNINRQTNYWTKSVNKMSYSVGYTVTTFGWNRWNAATLNLFSVWTRGSHRLWVSYHIINNLTGTNCLKDRCVINSWRCLHVVIGYTCTNSAATNIKKLSLHTQKYSFYSIVNNCVWFCVLVS